MHDVLISMEAWRRLVLKKPPQAAIMWDDKEAYANLAMDALRKGLRRTGFDVSRVAYGAMPGNPETLELAAVWGYREPIRDMIGNLWACHVPSLVLERGYIKRDEYFQCGLYHLNWIPETNDEPFKPERFKSLKIKRQGRRKPGDHILICGQLIGDAQHKTGLRKMISWVRDTFEQLKRHTDRELVWRPHPNAFPIKSGPLAKPASADRISDNKSLEDDLKNAHALVTYNSTSAISALLAGVPVFCDKNAIYAEVANLDLKDIEKPKWYSSKRFFEKLAYCQWNIAELEKGDPLEFLKPYLEVFYDQHREWNRGNLHGQGG